MPEMVLPDSTPDAVLLNFLRRKRLEEMTHNLSERGRGFSTGATPADAALLQSDINEDPDTGVAAHKAVDDVEAAQTGEAAFNSPGATAVRATKQKDKLAELLAVPQQQGANALAVENAKTQGALTLAHDKRDATQKLLETLTGGRGNGGTSGIGGPGSTIKPSINANGDVSFGVTPQPALVQRARNQLLDAHAKTLGALQEAERMYPGINDASTTADTSPSTGWGSYITGAGAPKYGSAMDQAGAGSERLKYTLGVPTPFANLAQTASFGNIEQMAGQLPGVRGLATITPLFKEHQSRWGHETPLATVQRLRHMAQLMEDTVHTLDTSGSAEPEPREY